jgi:HipA-like protein
VKSKLNVFVNQLKAGELWLDHQRRFCFQYDKNWINSKDSYRLSVSLPLRETAYVNDDSYAYFTNLLPEGKILAPFYDLLSTYVYPYAKKMAMKIGGGRHFQFLEPEHFERFSKDTSIKYKIVKETIVAMADKIAGEVR